MERPIDFWPDRHMLCGNCGDPIVVDLDWIELWECGKEGCPRCGLTCEHENAARVTVDPDDPALEDDHVASFFWYHTSTAPDWPVQDFDPTADLTAEDRRKMGGDVGIASVAAVYRAKALHVGTYAAAVHNMFRRMGDQADRDNQFYLYRVHLRPDVVVKKDWVPDPSDWLDTVVLEDVCPPGIDVTRYLNYHEDPGGLSLVLGRNEIASVQQVAIPLLDAGADDNWTLSAIKELEEASDTPVCEQDILGSWRPGPLPRAQVGQELGEALAARLPVNLRRQFKSAVSFSEGEDPAQWAR